MEVLLEILKYVLPSAIVFVTAYFLIKMFLDKEQKNKQLEKHIANAQIVTPIRIQAYERVVLLLERISPSSLIMRVHRPDINAMQLQNILVQTIREEFEHNLSQQVYLSSQAWEYVKTAKEEMIKIINVAASSISKDATATDLSQAIFAESLKTNELSVTIALEFVKKEIRIIF